MEERIIEALVGFTGSALFAMFKRKHALQIFTLGIAATALFVSLSNFTYGPAALVEEADDLEAPTPESVRQGLEAATLAGSEVLVITETITAHTKDSTHRETVWQTDEAFAMPSVPDPAKLFKPKNLHCPPSTTPLLAWREITTSHPTVDVIYTADVRIAGNGVAIALRARKGSRGYAYIDVSLLCRSQDSVEP